MGAEQNESEASKLGDRAYSTLQCTDRAVLQGKQQQDRPGLHQPVPKTGAGSSCVRMHTRPLTLQTEGRQRQDQRPVVIKNVFVFFIHVVYLETTF